MSRQEFDVNDGETGKAYAGYIGWDSQLGTHFCALYDKENYLDEPVVWLGNRFGQYPEQDEFLKELHQRSEAAGITTLTLPENIENSLAEAKKVEGLAPIAEVLPSNEQDLGCDR